MRYRYSEWDGTQDIAPLDPDDILAGLTDDLMNFGDLQHALRNLLQRGMRNPMGQRMQGLRDLLQQLRQQRRQKLDKYDLSSVFEDIQKRLDEIVDMETRRSTARPGRSRPADGRRRRRHRRWTSSSRPCRTPRRRRRSKAGQAHGAERRGAAEAPRGDAEEQSSRRSRTSSRTCRKTSAAASRSCRSTSSWTPRPRPSSRN